MILTKILNKLIDKKIEKLGFHKENDNEFRVEYTRKNRQYKYVQVVSILHKQSGKHIIQSYDKYSFDKDGVGNTCVGLTYTETKLFLKKMKYKKWKS